MKQDVTRFKDAPKDKTVLEFLNGSKQFYSWLSENGQDTNRKITDEKSASKFLAHFGFLVHSEDHNWEDDWYTVDGVLIKVRQISSVGYLTISWGSVEEKTVEVWS